MTFPQAPGFPGFPPQLTGYPQQPPAAAPQPIMGGNPMAAALAALNAAKVGNVSGNYLPNIPAAYMVEIETAEIKRTPRKGVMAFVTFKVLESSAPQVHAGAVHDWARGLEPSNDQYEYGRNDVKGWICGVVEALHPGAGAAWNDQFTPYVFAVEPATPEQHPQPARGLQCLVTTRLKPNKTKAGETTIVEWQFVPKGTTLASFGIQPSATVQPLPSGGTMYTPPPVPPAPAFVPPAPPLGMYAPPPAAPAQFTPTPMGPAATTPPPGWPPGLPWSPPR